MREVESLPGSQRLKAEPLSQSLRSTIRHYLGGHLHQFLLAYGEGLLPRQVELPCRAYVLNMPCGSGDWVCDMAYDHPLMEFVGVDPDPRRVGFAQSQADVQGFINTAFLAGTPGRIAPPDPCPPGLSVSMERTGRRVVEVLSPRRNAGLAGDAGACN